MLFLAAFSVVNSGLFVLTFGGVALLKHFLRVILLYSLLPGEGGREKPQEYGVIDLCLSEVATGGWDKA